MNKNDPKIVYWFYFYGKKKKKETLRESHPEITDNSFTTTIFYIIKRLRELSSEGGRLAHGGDNEAIPRQEKEERNPLLIASGNLFL